MWRMRAPVPTPGPERQRSRGRAKRWRWLPVFVPICFAALAVGGSGPFALATAGAPSAPHRADAVAASFLSAAVPGAQSPGSTDTMTVSPTSVPASSTSTLAFTYTLRLHGWR
jgi:hypothetical protein